MKLMKVTIEIEIKADPTDSEDINEAIRAELEEILEDEDLSENRFVSVEVEESDEE